MTKPPPTPCQRCKAELKEARAEVERLTSAACVHIRERNDLDARLVAAVNAHDEERRAWQAERERLLRGLEGAGDATVQDWARLVAERDAANALLDALRAEAASVNGTYKHPDQLEQAVCGAFDRMRALLAEPVLPLKP